MVCDLEIVNMVGSGKFDLEIELSAVAQESMFVENEWIQSVEHSRRSGNRLNISFTSTGGHGILAPSGVHVITGVDSQRELDRSQVALYNALEMIGLLDTNEPENVDFVVLTLASIPPDGEGLEPRFCRRWLHVAERI